MHSTRPHSHRPALALAVAFSLLVAAAPAQVDDLEWVSPLGPGGEYFGGEILLEGDQLFLAEERPAGGVVHAYVRNGSGWSLLQTLVPSAGLPNDEFGSGMEIEGDVLVIGAPDDSAFGIRAGAAYVFRRVQGIWVEEQRLVPPFLEAFDFYGRTIDVSGDRIVVASSGDDDQGPQAGAAFAFERAGGTWIQTQKLLPPPTSAPAFFGDSLSMDGDLMVLSASLAGAAYVYEFSQGSWVQVQRIDSNPPESYFAFRVDLEGDRFAMGSIFTRQNGSGPSVGSVSIYENIMGAWTEVDRLFAPDGSDGDRFGRALDLSGDRLVVGAPEKASALFSASDEGHAYLYEREGSDWVFRSKLRPEIQGSDEGLGWAVQVQGDEVIVSSVEAEVLGAVAGRVTHFDWPSETRVFCYCDDPTVAPCGNVDPTAGCVIRSEGARLIAGGTTSLAADDLRLFARGVPAARPVILFMGQGSGVRPLADGIVCVGAGPSGRVFRLGATVATSGGSATFGPGLGATSQSLPGGGAFMPGDTWFLQCWFWSPTGACGTGSGTTSAIELQIRP